MTETQVDQPQLETADDDRCIVHLVCCIDDRGDAPTLCGTPVDNFDPPNPAIDQDCAMCRAIDDEDPEACPLFGRCTETGDES